MVVSPFVSLMEDLVIRLCHPDGGPGNQVVSPLVSLREGQVMIESVDCTCGDSMDTQYMKAQKSLNQGLMNAAKLM